MKATLKQYRQSPRKVRLVANLIKGKKVEKPKEDDKGDVKPPADVEVQESIRSGAKRAYEGLLRRDRDLEGKIGYTYTIRPDGVVAPESIKITENTTSNEALAQAVRDAVRRARFSPRDKEKTMSDSVNFESGR